MTVLLLQGNNTRLTCGDRMVIGAALILKEDITDLGEISVQEQLQVIVDNSLTDGVDISKSISSSLEGGEPHQIYNLTIDVLEERQIFFWFFIPGKTWTHR